MAKTAAERQQARRAKLRLDRTELLKYRKKDADRKKISRLSMNATQLKALRKRGKVATRKWRLKLTAALQAPDSTPHTPHSSGHSEIHPYRTPASFGKAKRRVEKCLPKSPRKRAAVLVRLAEGLQVKVVTKTAANALDPAIKSAVIDFYNNDSMSRMMPGKADFVTVRQEDGTKERRQKRHLVMTVNEAFKEFTRENPLSKIGKSTFASLRPKHVLLNSDMPHNVCGCKYHSNMLLMIECLHRNIDMPQHLDEFIDLCVCNKLSESCALNECRACKDGRLFDKNVMQKISNKGIEVQWYAWRNDEGGYLSKCLQKGTLESALASARDQLPQFIWHQFIKRRQASAYESQKQSAQTLDSSTCLLQMDFAENYTVSFQDEIQSAHWQQRQVSLYTVMVWHRETVISKVIVSDCRDHDKKAVAAFTSNIFDMIRSVLPAATAVNIWTDGPSSQFKNKYIFSFISKLQDRYTISVSWHFFATSHGKGPNDALGGNVKRMAHRQTMSRRLVIADANSFADAVNMSTDVISVTVMSQEDIDTVVAELKLDELWNTILPMPGIFNTHCVQVINGQVQCKLYSDSQDITRVHSLSKDKSPKSKKKVMRRHATKASWYICYKIL